MPGGAVRILAGWLCHLRGMGAAINDPYASELVTAAAGPLPDAAARILLRLDLELAADEQLVRTVAAAARELTASRRTSD
jgi:fructuronate reductase